MEKKEKKLLNNPWVIKVGGTIFSVFIIRLIDYSTGSNLWEWIYNISNREYTWKIYEFIFLGLLLLINLIFLARKERLNKGRTNDINLQLNSINSSIKSIWLRFQEIEIMIRENRSLSINTSDANTDLLELSTLIRLSNEYYKKTGDKSHLNNTLDGIINHHKKHNGSISPYEKDRLFYELKNIQNVHELKIKEIDSLFGFG